MPWQQSFTDWRNNGDSDNRAPTPQQLFDSGEWLVDQTNLVNAVNGNLGDSFCFVYGYSFRLPIGKTLVSVTLPDNSSIGILGMALVT